MRLQQRGAARDAWWTSSTVVAQLWRARARDREGEERSEGGTPPPAPSACEARGVLSFAEDGDEDENDSGSEAPTVVLPI